MRPFLGRLEKKLRIIIPMTLFKPTDIAFNLHLLCLVFLLLEIKLTWLTLNLFF